MQRNQADGQWFLFHLRREHPGAASRPPELQRHASSRSAQSIAADLVTLTAEQAQRDHRVSQLENELKVVTETLKESKVYADFLVREIDRKNNALKQLEDHVRDLEARLIEARSPRLPWKSKKRPRQ